MLKISRVIYTIIYHVLPLLIGKRVIVIHVLSCFYLLIVIFDYNMFIPYH